MKDHQNLIINSTFVIVLILGIGISALVDWRSEKIINTTLELVDEQIPYYDTFEKFHGALIEQERYLYEYFTTEENTYYSMGYRQAELKTQKHLKTLETKFVDSNEIIQTRKHLDTIESIAEKLHLNLANDGDWSIARQQLSEISKARRAILPYTEALQEQAAKQLIRSHDTVVSNSRKVSVYVLIHFAVTLMLAFVVAKAVRASINNASSSRRLALFPKRNPNPVISIDQSNDITFYNPATIKLLDKLKLTEAQVMKLLPEQIDEYKNTLCDNAKHNCADASTRFEYKIDQTALSCELHWLNDVKQWDLHIADITAQKRAEEKLKYQASHHPETCLSNQYALQDRIEKHIHSENTADAFTLTIISLHDFDRLQLSKGHERTQHIVNQVSACIQIVIASDGYCESQVYQVGDNDFAIIHPNANDTQKAQSFVESLNKHINETIFQYQYQPKLHFGITQYPDYGLNLEELLQTARNALDNVNPDSSQRYCLYNHTMGERLVKEQQLTDDIKSAINNNEFTLFFQPQVDISTQKVTGAEVLVRWPRDTAWVSPGEFIPLAERSGLIIPLGNWILRSACLAAKEWVDQGHSDLVMAVNISPKQFTQNNFLDLVTDILQETGLPPHNLELEITEGVIMHNETKIIESLEQLKSIGVLLAIDDFGTGYSSLSYLKQFPIDKLKIDRSFVQDMHTNIADESIVKTIIDLGRNLDLKLIAEGVEEQAQWDLLAQLGCHEIQGYFFCKPIPKDPFSDFLTVKTAG